MSSTSDGTASAGAVRILLWTTPLEGSGRQLLFDAAFAPFYLPFSFDELSSFVATGGLELHKALPFLLHLSELCGEPERSRLL